MDFNYVVVPALIVLFAALVIWLAIRRIRSLSSKSCRKWRKIVERVVLASIGTVVAVIAITAAFNAIALFVFRARNPPPGTTYLVNGHAMHIDCSGTGSPTIVLEAGLGNDDLIWGGVQPVLSRTTRVCSYDRAGFGWSQVLPPPRDADHIADELHGLLSAAKIDGPIVLMGHSIAGIYMRDYVSRYPQGIVGLIFVDGSTPLQNRWPAFQAAQAHQPPVWAVMLLMRAAFSAGIPRPFGQCSRTLPGFNAHASELEAQDLCHAQVGAMAAEMDSVDRSGEETIHTGPYGDLPILIFSHDPAKSLSAKNPPAQTVNMEAAWTQMQENLKQLSSRSRRIVAKGSSHYIQIDRADLIEKEVPLFIAQIRGAAPPQSSYGTTVTE
jgi:pimeloyl-ACP methyl ester carboxylesterase